MAGFVLDDVCTPSDFRDAETQYKVEIAKGINNKSSQFQYAWCLVRTSKRENLETGCALLEDLYRKSADDSEKRDYLYYMAVAYAKLKDYEKAIRFLDGILKVQPRNHQVADLKVEVEKRMKRDGLLGIGIAAGAAAVGIAGIATLIGLAVTKR